VLVERAQIYVFTFFGFSSFLITYELNEIFPGTSRFACNSGYAHNIHIFITYAHRPDALQKNQDMEFERNRERFMFLKVSNVTALTCLKNNRMRWIIDPFTSTSMPYNCMLQAMVVDHIMNAYERHLKWHCLPSFNDIVLLYRLGNCRSCWWNLAINFKYSF